MKMNYLLPLLGLCICNTATEILSEKKTIYLAHYQQKDFQSEIDFSHFSFRTSLYKSLTFKFLK